jgi:hypothetical protein
MFLMSPGLLLSYHTQEEQEVSVERIRRIWENREARTVVLEWVDRVKVPKEHILLLQKLEPARAKHFLVADVEYDEFTRLSLDGPRWKIAGQGKVRDSKGEMVPEDRTVVCDGSTVKSLSEKTGVVGPGNATKVPGAINLLTPFFVFRALTFRLIDLENYKLSDQKSDINGTLCYALEKEKENSFEKHVLWVAPSLGFALVRYSVLHRGAIVSKTDFEYKNDKRFGHVPARWNIVDAGDGASFCAEVRKCEIGVTFSDDEFQLAFPRGTHVTDLTQKTATKKVVRYVVGEQGKPWILIAIVVVVILCVTFFLFREKIGRNIVFRWRKNDE